MKFFKSSIQIIISFILISITSNCLKAEYDTSIYIKKDLYDYTFTLSPYFSKNSNNYYDLGLDSAYHVNKFWSIGLGISYGNKDIKSLDTQIISAKEKTVNPLEYDTVNIEKKNNQSFFNVSVINNLLYKNFIFQVIFQTGLNKPTVYTGNDIYIDYEKEDGTLNEAGEPNTTNIKTKYRNDSFFYTYNISFNIGYKFYKDLYGLIIYNITYDSYQTRRYIYSQKQGEEEEQILNSYIARNQEQNDNFTNHYFGFKLMYSFSLSFK